MDIPKTQYQEVVHITIERVGEDLITIRSTHDDDIGIPAPCVALSTRAAALFVEQLFGVAAAGGQRVAFEGLDLLRAA